MKKFLLCLMLLMNFTISQLNLSKDEINFPQQIVNSIDSMAFYIINLSPRQIHINKIFKTNISFFLLDSAFLINAKDSIKIFVYYKPAQNVIDNDLISFQSDDSIRTAILKVSGSGKYDDSYDNSTFNLYDVELKNALKNLVANHTSLGYNLARDKMFMEIDNQKVNGQGQPQNTCECVYTGRKAIGYTSRSDIQTNYNFNTEHTWPQSFFNSNEPMLSDLFHLFPTDETANSMRSNYPFGVVVSGITWNNGGSKLGKNNYNQIVFEPRDVHKGNVARSLLYFVIRYQNYGNFLDTTQEKTFRAWNYFDSVNQVERKRNYDISVLQGKRNPFIDHPEFVDRIYSFISNSNRPTEPILKIFPQKIFFDSTKVGDSSITLVYICNYGNSKLSISSVATSNPKFYVSFYIDTISSISYQRIKIVFKPDLIGNFYGSLSIFSNAGNQVVNLFGIGANKTVDIKESSIDSKEFKLYQNYPNPFNSTSKIKFKLAQSSFVSLKIFDVLGRELTTLINELKDRGEYEIEFSTDNLSFSKGWITSGVYYYKLKYDDLIQTKKMILLR